MCPVMAASALSRFVVAIDFTLLFYMQLFASLFPTSTATLEVSPIFRVTRFSEQIVVFAGITIGQLRSAAQGADTVTWLCITPTLRPEDNGAFFEGTARVVVLALDVC
jgi:hypothetical protein